MRTLLTSLIVVAAVGGPLQAQSSRFGRVWDGEKVLTNAVIVFDNGRIKSVGTSSGDATDMSRYTALPGLIDVHTHMTFVPTSILAALTQAGRSAATVYLSQDAAKKTLETGVTTVRNLNAQNYEDIAMRDLINAGLMVGPRMFVSGYGLHITRGNDIDPSTADGPAAPRPPERLRPDSLRRLPRAAVPHRRTGPVSSGPGRRAASRTDR